MLLQRRRRVRLVVLSRQRVDGVVVGDPQPDRECVVPFQVPPPWEEAPLVVAPMRDEVVPEVQDLPPRLPPPRQAVQVAVLCREDGPPHFLDCRVVWELPHGLKPPETEQSPLVVLQRDLPQWEATRHRRHPPQPERVPLQRRHVALERDFVMRK